jgi:hypothetical protein
MTSIIDELIEQLAPHNWSARLAGIRFAKAGNRTWQRDPQQPEGDFLDRVREEPAAAGHKTDCSIRGWIKVWRSVEP